MPHDASSALFIGASDGIGLAAALAASEARMAARLPVGHVAIPQEIASAYLFLMQNAYVTGALVDIDGGGSILPAR